MKHFTPVGKIITEVETDGQKLQRLAQASLPKYVDAEEKEVRRRRRRCMCGEILPANPKTRQKEKVCDSCARSVPRLQGGRALSCSCFECGAVVARVKLKVKNGKLYCKKCLKLKFHIDF